MEIVLLNETELRVTLTADDMERYAIDCAHMDYGTAETRRAFRAILDEAREKTGFDAAQDRICIRVCPGADGGCSLYVTRLPSAEASGPSSCGIRENAPSADRAEPCPTVYALDVPDLDGLIGVCAYLHEHGCDPKGDAYVMDCGGERYFLAVREEHRGQDVSAALLDEFGIRIASSAMRLCLTEHARCIASGDAVRSLAALA